MLGKDGNLYFAHAKAEDSRSDYTCNIQYLATRSILPKEPISLTVTSCESETLWSTHPFGDRRSQTTDTPENNH